MRTRVAIVAVSLVVAAGLSACSSDDKDKADAKKSPSAPVTDTTTLDCAKFAGTSQSIADAQAKLYGTDAAARSAAIDALAGELDALKKDAPDDVDEALETLIKGFRTAEKVMADPTGADAGELTELGPKLAEAGQTVTAYVAEECKA